MGRIVFTGVATFVYRGIGGSFLVAVFADKLCDFGRVICRQFLVCSGRDGGLYQKPAVGFASIGNSDAVILGSDFAGRMERGMATCYETFLLGKDPARFDPGK